MKSYRILITQPDGSRCLFFGLYADGFDAVIQTMTTYPDAKRISARRISA
ncbi:hypothetical protein [Rhodoferax sp.]|nr:hypothetical protein [Rhodoferax sp.]MCM2340438.1 hypothetical protein [Rhodoferax sp.]